MPRLRHPKTGSVVNVPDEKVDQVTALGYEPADTPPKKTAAKKTTDSK